MATLASLEARIKSLEDKINAAVPIPEFVVDIDSTEQADKTGYWVVGRNKAGIQDGSSFIGLSNTANPTLNTHFTEFLIVK